MSRDTSFYYSFLVLPRRKRQAIVAVWDFCRAVDDAVDEVAPRTTDISDRARRETAAAALALWRRELAAVYADSGVPQTSQGRALQPFARQFALPRTEFESLVDGVEMDLQYDRYPTFDALAEYCRRVAGTVGLICLNIFGYRDAASREYALSLAMALQLTNIVRDVGADLAHGRIYLPTEDLVRFGVSEADLAQGHGTSAVRSLLEFECQRARDYFRQASALLPSTDRHRLVAAEIMGGIYFGILTRVERADYDVFSSRVRVPRPARLLIALRIWARSCAGMSNGLG